MTANPWLAVDAATVPAKRARELRDAWEDFVAQPSSQADDGLAGADTTDGTESIHVRLPIADSWRRSRDAGVDPSGRHSAPSVADLSDARSLWRGHPLAAAAPIIRECLSEAAGEADHLMVVSDADGVLLSVEGSTYTRGRAADMMNFVEGALWSEAGAGTNAVGTAIAAGHAVQVFAAEHFTEPVQRWTCSAAPVREPENGSVIGVIDLTGDFTGVHPHSLSVVVATARAVEGFLRLALLERDDLLRTRHGERLDPGAVRRALVTESGRVLIGHPEHWDPARRLVIPSGGGALTLPSGVQAIAEPVGDDAYVVARADTSARATATPHVSELQLSLLGPEQPRAVVDGRAVPLRRRHAELLALLTVRPRGASAEVLCADLYGDDGHPGAIRVEMSRLRKLLGDALDGYRYRLSPAVSSDAERVRALLRASDVRAAARAYTGPLLPDSEAPGVARERDELDGWLRHAVISSDDAEALWSWVQCASGTDDLLAWSRLLSHLDAEDPRRSFAAARTHALREALRQTTQLPPPSL
ncbi:helix-turn-helix domain-containing protein [Conexibacter sp. CPCC 206217]|uniref:helix-turn-helix domain-containing protein n=1 Tax=Conexibacter sp. CPCC 206217 TaxID=3064574 RepID=UPI00271ED9A6|nr:helix-turn-helix domain-containing protein [Conexibacter sp. CPCC 206217]MDO8212476.1 hypothetical protein [Conexibacter sp. CPCC 206217]